MDVVQEVKEGRAIYEWTEVVRAYNGYTLYVSVLRDAMKFNNVPELNYRRQLIQNPSELMLDGVRLPASAKELQQIADLIGAMLLTPIIIEEIWLQAELKFDANINSGPPKYNIVATTDIHDVHRRIEDSIKKLGGDDGTKLISCVGKYWCLINALRGLKVQGFPAACNFGWMWRNGATGTGVTQRVRCWQRPGYRHSYEHLDPSQTIRLMHRLARLVFPDGTERQVDLHDIADDPKLAGLIHHNSGKLYYLRQEGVEELPMMGTITLPEVTIYGDPNAS